MSCGATEGLRAHCQKPDCGRSWPRDPAREVVCPVCDADVGAPCRRPSGHRLWQWSVHAERDVLADQAGHYGRCPSGRCGLDRLSAGEAQERLL